MAMYVPKCVVKQTLFSQNLLILADWSDAGKPTVGGEDPSSETAFKNCLASEKCNFEAVKGYMRNFDQVCIASLVRA